jgi:hypothetical protein
LRFGFVSLEAVPLVSKLFELAMAPCIAENQGFTEQYIRSGDPIQLGLSKASHTLGKPSTTAAGSVPAGAVRREQGSGGPHIPEHAATAAMLPAPTIRVIHIYAPKIIKTDVANFRSTVQRLTGRPSRSCKADTAGAPQRRARTKTVVAVPCSAPPAAAESSPDPALGFQDTDHHGQQQQLLSRQRVCAPACAADSMFQSCNRLVEDVQYSTDQDSPIRCSNTMAEISTDYSNMSIDSSFSFYTSSVDSRTAMSNNDEFFSHRQAPYSLDEIPAPYFFSAAGSDVFLPGSTDQQILMPDNSNQVDYASQTGAYTTVPCDHALTGITSSTRDSGMPLPIAPPLDYNELAAAGFSDLDILTGLGSTLPDLPLNLPPLSLSSTANGLTFYDSVQQFVMQPRLCR